MVVVSGTLIYMARKNWRSKALLTVTCLACQIAMGTLGCGVGTSLSTHAFYMLTHVNAWHLLCNLLVLWSIKGRMETKSALAIAFLASYIPTLNSGVTAGLSGVLFALFGIMWGRTGRLGECLKKGLPVIVLTMVLPGVNGLLHLYCYLIGYVWGWLRSCFRFLIFS